MLLVALLEHSVITKQQVAQLIVQLSNLQTQLRRCARIALKHANLVSVQASVLRVLLMLLFLIKQNNATHIATLLQFTATMEHASPPVLMERI